MDNNWLLEFGFKKNPYDTMALSASEEGSRLLIGRDDEVKFLKQQLTSSSMIPLLYGENGVGKSSIANVVAYRLSEEYSYGEKRFFFLPLKSIQGTQLSELNVFEKNIYREVIFLLLNNKKFLRNRGIKYFEIMKVDKLIRQMGNVGWGGGIGPLTLNLSYSPNSSSENIIPSIARKWLEQCFSEPYSGGIICVIDNLENSGTSNQVKHAIESLRDTLFTMPGLLWILCGTPFSVEGIRTSKIMQGYLAEKKIDPISENIIPAVVKQRIIVYGEEKVDPPVSEDLFEVIYAIVNKQLRSAFALCQEFAFFLYNNPEWRIYNRKNELKKWLDHMAINLPEKENEVSDKSWQLFDNIIMLGSEISIDDLELLNLSSKDEFDSLASSLIAKRLLEIVETDYGFVGRITRDGWLVNYKRNNYSIGEEKW